MADNYLEKHYEEYEARKAAWEKAKKLGKKNPSVSGMKVKTPKTTDKSQK